MAQSIHAILFQMFKLSGKKDRMLQLEHEKVQEEIEVSKTRIAEAEAKLSDAKRGREDEEGERAKKLARLEELGKENVRMETEMKSLKENDPQALANLEKELKLVMEAANRWTDNIFSVSTMYMYVSIYYTTTLFNVTIWILFAESS